MDSYLPLTLQVGKSSITVWAGRSIIGYNITNGSLTLLRDIGEILFSSTDNMGKAFILQHDNGRPSG